MIEFIYNTNWQVPQEEQSSHWLNSIVVEEGHVLWEFTYQFVTDERLLEVNLEHLNHDFYTDIITFDHVQGNMVFGDIFISVDRVEDNATKFDCSMEEEMKRVMAHGLLHLLGYEDGTPEEKKVMRKKEEECIKMFHVEQ